MKMVLRLLLLALLFSGWAMAQTNDPTAGGAVKPATPKKNPLADARTVKSGGSESGKTEDKEKVESAGESGEKYDSPGG